MHTTKFPKSDSLNYYAISASEQLPAAPLETISVTPKLLSFRKFQGTLDLDRICQHFQLLSGYHFTSS